ncbi:hypothetical protein Asulf_00814 [Archaeoglobus sulfaticallidus PM70-1]|uniref:Integral membrane protein n=1 Tax=Archaeoglobus sulfaticallidus PM70-1 TaxID=387631 RepID=N0BCS9_9EURY|nr:flippase-like domain-containing protein [Archaeoglobus sulfaticallidus]AGK60823.1 hypothetical protein Asulf_00814 [Archaeoglobus sulfaticallidus PM70-1]
METTEKNNIKNLTKILLAIGISLATIFIIFKLTETELTWKVISALDKKFLAVALLFHIAFWAFWALRLQYLSLNLGKRISFSYALQATISSSFLAAITPSSAGGEPLRAKMLSDAGMSYGEATATVLAERLLDAIFFITALPFMVILSGFKVRFGVYAGVIFTITFIGFLVLMYMIFKDQENIDKITSKISFIFRFWKKDVGSRVYDVVKKELLFFRSALIDLAKIPKLRILVLLILTSLTWIFEFCVPSALLLAMKSHPYWIESIASQLFLIILSLIPLTPGASGIAETGMLYFYSYFVNSAYMGTLVGLWRIITYHTNLVVGLLVNIKVFGYRYIQ